MIVANPSAVIINEGKVSFTGETVQQFYIGGISAFVSKYAIPATVKLINTGDIVATGKSGEGLEKNCVVSGIIGSLKSPIDGAQCFCNINAPMYTAQTGMLEGKSRTASVLYKNAKVGGTICRSTEDKEDSEGTLKPTPIVETLSGENFFDYIYGPTVDWSAITPQYDGCSYISSKEEIDYTVPVVPDPEA